MMSLFTPFDTLIYSASFLLFPLFFLVSLNFLGPSNMLAKFIYSFKENISSFFYSLKPSFFSKSFSIGLFSLFFAVMFLNLMSVWPYIFAPTSQVSVVLSMALLLWLAMIFFLTSNNIGYFMAHSVPEGAPLYLTWFLFLIEMISNCIRPVTLTVRLVANILAGHLLMILLSGLIAGTSLAFPFYMGLNLVELFVALIQSYIFCTMICLYFSEVH